MKILTIAVLVLFTVVVKGFSTERADSIKIVGLNLYHSNSGSGFGSGLNMNFSIEQERRHLEIGLIYQTMTHELSGGEVIYRHYLNSPFKAGAPGTTTPAVQRKFRTYLQYNFIFRQSSIPSNPGPGHQVPVSDVSLGRVATFEHYIGAGIQVALLHGVYLNAGMGYGITLGSIDEKFMTEMHYTDGGRRTDSGLATKFGIGYFFNR